MAQTSRELAPAALPRSRTAQRHRPTTSKCWPRAPASAPQSTSQAPAGRWRRSLALRARRSSASANHYQHEQRLGKDAAASDQFSPALHAVHPHPGVLLDRARSQQLRQLVHCGLRNHPRRRLVVDDIEVLLSTHSVSKSCHPRCVAGNEGGPCLPSPCQTTRPRILRSQSARPHPCPPRG